MSEWSSGRPHQYRGCCTMPHTCPVPGCAEPESLSGRYLTAWVSCLSRGRPSQRPPGPPGAAGLAPQGRGMRGCRAGASCLIWHSLTATLDLHLLFISIRLKRNSTTAVFNLPSSVLCPMRAVV